MEVKRGKKEGRPRSFLGGRRLTGFDLMSYLHCLHRSASSSRIMVMVFSAVLHWHLEEKICIPLVPQAIQNVRTLLGILLLSDVSWGNRLFEILILPQAPSGKRHPVVLKGIQVLKGIASPNSCFRPRGRESVWIQDNPFCKQGAL